MKEKIDEFLETFARGRYSGSRIQSTPEVTFLVLGEHVKATRRQLAILESKVTGIYGASVTVTRHSDHLRETFMSALSAILADAVGLTVEGAHFELVGNKTAQVFLAVSSEHSKLTKTTRDRIAEAASSLGKPLGIESLQLEISGHGHSTINDALVIREALRVAPVNAESLAIVMSDSEKIDRTFTTAEAGVMLDRLRRKGLLVWQESGKYAPTQQALYLYSSPKSKRSSDVMRALELGRKRW